MGCRGKGCLGRGCCWEGVRGGWGAGVKGCWLLVEGASGGRNDWGKDAWGRRFLVGGVLAACGRRFWMKGFLERRCLGEGVMWGGDAGGKGCWRGGCWREGC